MSLRDFGLFVFVCLLWAANNIVSKYVVSTLAVPPLFYAGLRFVVVLAGALPWLLPAPRPLRRVVVVALLMGALNFGGVFLGLRFATASSVAVALQLSLPTTLLLSALLLGERVSARRGAGMALTFAGVMLVMWDPHGLSLSIGLLFVVGAVVATSLGAILMKRLQGVRPMQYQAWVGFISVAPLFAASALVEQGQLQTAAAAGWALVAAVLFSGVLVSLLSHSIFYVLVQRHDANLVSALSLMNPLLTILLGVALFHEPFGPRIAAGGVMALAGVLVIVAPPDLARRLPTARTGGR